MDPFSALLFIGGAAVVASGAEQVSMLQATTRLGSQLGMLRVRGQIEELLPDWIDPNIPSLWEMFDIAQDQLIEDSNDAPWFPALRERWPPKTYDAMLQAFLGRTPPMQLAVLGYSWEISNMLLVTISAGRARAYIHIGSQNFHEFMDYFEDPVFSAKEQAFYARRSQFLDPLLHQRFNWSADNPDITFAESDLLFKARILSPSEASDSQEKSLLSQISTSYKEMFNHWSKRVNDAIEEADALTRKHERGEI